MKPFRHLPPRRFPEIERKHGSNGRFYQVRGRRYPSVTRVVNYFDPEIKKRWEAKLRREGRDPKAESQQAMDLGTKFHAVIESYLNNSVRDKPIEVLRMFEGIRPLLDRIDDIACTEKYLYSKLWGLAGTVDCIASFDGVPSVIDFKSTRKLKTHIRDIPDYMAQTAAYAEMWEERTGEKINQVVILMVDREGNSRDFVDKQWKHLGHLTDRVIQWKNRRA